MVTITLSLDATKLAVKPSGYNPDVHQMMQSIIGKRWHKPWGCWLTPFSKEALDNVKTLLSQVTDVRIDQKVLEALDKQDTRASNVVELKSQAPGVIELPADFTWTTEPMKHQKVAISLGLKNKSFAYFMEMGTGKTKVMLDLIGHYLLKIREHKKPALIVCPVSVMYNWERQVKIHRPELKVKVLSGNGTKKSEGLQFDADLYVVNYESVWRIFDALSAIQWGFMVLDESTRIKNRGTKQARAILKLGAGASRRYILTGTPSPNSPLELFNQIRFLDPNLFGHNWYFFRDRYCLMGGYGGYQVLGFRNLAELSQKISGISYRVLKSECLDLPDKIYKQYRLPMSEKQAKAYKELSEELVTDIAGTEIRTEVVLAKLTKLRQIASGFVYLDGKEAHHFENNKIEKLKELLTEHGSSHKFVVWVSFKEEINLIVKLLNELKMAFEFLDGSVSQENRAKRIQEFQENVNVRVFLANQRSGGIGIDLFAADYCVFFSNDYSPEIRLQAEDRLHRIGQRNHVTYIDLVSRASIDSIILRMLSSKQDVSNQVMTGKIKVKEIIYGDDAEF